MSARALFAVSLLATLTGCSGDDPNASATPDTPCPSDSLCFDVKPVAEGLEIASGRVAVVWQASGYSNRIVPMAIAYHQAFDGAAARVEIPLSVISPPPYESLNCMWDCFDTAPCTCEHDWPTFGVASIRIAPGGSDGTLSVDDLSGAYGVGSAFITHVGPQASAAAEQKMPLFDRLPGGLLEGTHVYAVHQREGVAPGEQEFVLREDGELLDLHVCSFQQPTCVPPTPIMFVD
ncbi:hypothetical protein [Chondromyces crocatus]|uniref:Lipoprotein n=1 Tax=Chondromyces crocatus TaxID=52 RepID=A0A0K1EJ37_CHOCO|nr:hypothetical protein [Chondromyces crocatus]AKT40682.1 uncharacterized protein CMC5_048380 [Chondromyces crocatus]